MSGGRQLRERRNKLTITQLVLGRSQRNSDNPDPSPGASARGQTPFGLFACRLRSAFPFVLLPRPRCHDSKTHATTTSRWHRAWVHSIPSSRPFRRRSWYAWLPDFRFPFQTFSFSFCLPNIRIARSNCHRLLRRLFCALVLIMRISLKGLGFFAHPAFLF